MKFDLYCTKPIYEGDKLVNILRAKLLYDNSTSELFHSDGSKFEFKKTRDITHTEFPAISEQIPGKKANIKTLKIQLGLSCNYSCEYCSQRFVPNAPETNPSYVDRFINTLDLWIWARNPPERIEFWGGEPLVYWKTIKPLSEKLRIKYPKTQFLMITNGSLLNDEIIDWIEEYDISVGISHDGPGQHVRGPDPFDNEETKKYIFKLLELRPEKTSINSMIHRDNISRAAVQNYFENLLGDRFKFLIGEGGFIDSYDEGGKAMNLHGEEEHYIFRDLTLREIRERKNEKFRVVKSRIMEWFDSITNERRADSLGQKCGMDREDTIAVDLRGNVVTCQNVSAVSTAPNGRSHLIGHVTKLDKVRLTTATHWKFRKECSNCPVLQLCKGSCMFLQDELFKISCDSAYSDHIPFFAAAIEEMTGWLPYRIEAHGYELPDDRKDLWGQNYKRNKNNATNQN